MARLGWRHHRDFMEFIVAYRIRAAADKQPGGWAAAAERLAARRRIFSSTEGSDKSFGSGHWPCSQRGSTPQPDPISISPYSPNRGDDAQVTQNHTQSVSGTWHRFYAIYRFASAIGEKTRSPSWLLSAEDRWQQQIYPTTALRRGWSRPNALWTTLGNLLIVLSESKTCATTDNGII